jgi:hypothetical protein
MPPNLAIRYHFPLEVALDPREPVIIETLIPNSTDFKQWGVAPDDIRNMALIHTYLLEVARKHGGGARPRGVARCSAPLRLAAASAPCWLRPPESAAARPARAPPVVSHMGRGLPRLPGARGALYVHRVSAILSWRRTG